MIKNILEWSFDDIVSFLGSVSFITRGACLPNRPGPGGLGGAVREGHRPPSRVILQSYKIGISSIGAGHGLVPPIREGHHPPPLAPVLKGAIVYIIIK